MVGYLIANYRIEKTEAYEAYPPAVVPTILSYGGEVLVADYESEVVEGQASSVSIVLKFRSKDDALTWYNSSEYREIVHHRTDNSEGFVLFADEYAIP
ncbi:hypothetical protein A3709_01175 [Halioglobus sp. HI00S01]|uniref:DUF1330 domain-containing protein n=1 Tax=Halioglobus sp. HI00S01 TaxID=1822214 RepID=UPI0007C3A9BF|nr:DUF1330 domain-containing protein [Halioglobus sp. HI00S01]KZX60705.1 hypothetical protein A3709_01175 [Halioglobus sp. HI00S01]